MKFSMTCTCGDTNTVDVNDKEEAVSKFKTLMTAEMIAAHMADKHPGQPVMSVADCHKMIEQQVVVAQ